MQNSCLYEMYGSQAKMFKNIFPDYETFKSWYLSSPLCDGENDIPNKKTFALIYNEYCVSRINSTEEVFKLRFSNELYTYYKEFEKTSEEINKLMLVTDDEISTADSTVRNIANIPENTYDTNSESVNFVSTQEKVISKKGNLQVRREQISNKRSLTTRTFLNRFQKLFERIISPAYVFVVENEE